VRCVHEGERQSPQIEEVVVTRGGPPNAAVKKNADLENPALRVDLGIVS